MLTTSQQATLEQTYTAALARKWSNLPCGASCRNGIGLGTLTPDQLTAALATVQAAMGTAANEGFDEFQQIRLADDNLAANGGGSGYGSGIYYLAFLNTPNATGAWMMQFGGHHYAANIAFNQGHIVATTPHFYGLEPTSFTSNGTTYAPLAQEHDAMTAMLASLDTSQLASARLTQTYSDATMIPGETNGGNGTFPTTKVGLAVSALSSAQKQLVLDAMKPWVQDMDSAVGARFNWSFTPKSYLEPFVQYNSRTNQVGTNIRFALLSTSSNGLYVVDNTKVATMDFLDPHGHERMMQSQALLVKSN